MIQTTIHKASYFAQLMQAVKRIFKASEDCQKTTAEDLYLRIVDLTPVGDPSLWSFPASKDYVPGTLKAAWELDISKKDITITNTTPYAYRVEYEHWSTQAPAGMMRTACKEFPDILSRVSSEYKI